MSEFPQKYCTATLLLALVIGTPPAYADDFVWTNIADGNFDDPNKWTLTGGSGPPPPDTGDVALFNAPGLYTVTFGGNESSGVLDFDRGSVTLRSATSDVDYSISSHMELDSTNLILGAAGNALDLFVDGPLDFGSGSLRVQHGSELHLASATIGSRGNADMTVEHSGSELLVDGNVDLGEQGTLGSLTLRGTGVLGAIGGLLGVANGTSAAQMGRVTVQSGARLETGDVQIAAPATGGANRDGGILVDGAGSMLTMNGASTLAIGMAGRADYLAKLEVFDFGIFQSGTGDITIGQAGTLDVRGGGQFHGSGDLTITSGGVATIHNDSDLNLHDASLTIRSNSRLTLDGGTLGMIEDGNRNSSQSLRVDGDLELKNGGRIFYDLEDNSRRVLQVQGGNLHVSTPQTRIDGSSVLSMIVASGGRAMVEDGAQMTARNVEVVDGEFVADGEGTFVRLGQHGDPGGLSSSTEGTGIMTFRNSAHGSFEFSEFTVGDRRLLNIESGAELNMSDLVLLHNGTGQDVPQVTVTGAESKLNITSLDLGRSLSRAPTKVSIETGGTLDASGGIVVVRQNSTLEVDGGTFNFTQSGGDPLTIDGELTITGGGELNYQDNGVPREISIAGNVRVIDGGRLNVPGGFFQLTGGGSLHVSNAVVDVRSMHVVDNVDALFENGATLIADFFPVVQGSIIVDNSTVIHSELSSGNFAIGPNDETSGTGTITFRNGALLDFSTTSPFVRHGSLNIESGAMVSFPALSLLRSSSVVTVRDPESVLAITGFGLTIGGTSLQPSRLEVLNEGTLDVSATTALVQENSTLEVDNATATFTDTAITNEGTILARNGGTIDARGTAIDNSSGRIFIDVGGDLNLANGASIIGGSIQSGGRIGVVANETASLRGNSISINDALVHVAGSAQLEVLSERISGTGRWHASGGTISLSEATDVRTSGTVDITDGGRFDVPAGSRLSGSVISVQSNGILNVQGGNIDAETIDLQGGTLTGWSVIAADVVSGGQIQPAGESVFNIVANEDTGAAGYLTLGANSELTLSIDGPGNQHDQILVHDDVTIDGVFNVQSMPDIGDVITASDRFLLLASLGSLTGTFDNALPGQRIPLVGADATVRIDYGPTSPFPFNHVVVSDYLHDPFVTTWIAAVGNWADDANWDTGIAPINSGADRFDAIITSGQPSVSTPVEVHGLTFAGGSLIVNDTLSVTSDFEWTGGNISGSGTILLSGSGIFDLPAGSITNAAITNNGVVDWQSGSIGASVIPRALLRNQGTFLITADDDRILQPTVINEPGATVRHEGSGTISFLSTENDGTVDINGGGTLQFMNHTGDGSDGDFVVNAGRLEFRPFGFGVRHTVRGSITGEEVAFLGTTNVLGTYNVTTTEVNGEVTFETAEPAVTSVLNLADGGNLRAEGTVETQTLNWTGGVMSGTAEIVLSGSGVINSPGAVISDATLTNNGTLDWQRGSIIGTFIPRPPLQNQNTFLITIDANEEFRTPLINAEGATISHTGSGVVRLSVELDNAGTLVITGGGEVTLPNFSVVAQHVGDTLTGGTWDIHDGGTLTFVSGSDIVTNQGEVILRGPNSVLDKINTLADNQGRFEIHDGRGFSTAGDLANSGQIVIGAGSTLTVSGVYTQTGVSSQLDVRDDGLFQVTQGGFQVQDGAALTGNGVIEAEGEITIDQRGIVAPGASPGSITTTANLTFGDAAIYQWELAVDGSDTVIVDGALTLGDSATLELIDLGGTPDPLQEYVLFRYAPTNSDPTNPIWAIDATAARNWDTSALSIFVDADADRVILTGLDELLRCDFDVDGVCDIGDIDMLVTQIATGQNESLFDLNGDGHVTRADINDVDNGWLRLAGEENFGPGLSYLEGDVNLSGAVDASDFNIWRSNSFSVTGAWSLADLNADGVTDVSDFNIWNVNKFKSSIVAPAVPEPHGDMLLLCAMLWFGLRSTFVHSRRAATA